MYRVVPTDAIRVCWSLLTHLSACQQAAFVSSYKRTTHQTRQAWGMFVYAIWTIMSSWS